MIIILMGFLSFETVLKVFRLQISSDAKYFSTFVLSINNCYRLLFLNPKKKKNNKRKHNILICKAI